MECPNVKVLTKNWILFSLEVSTKSGLTEIDDKENTAYLIRF